MKILKNTFFLLCVLCLTGCSDDIQDKERYRWIIGETTAGLLITSMHLNEVVMSKAVNNTVSERDEIRIEDSLAALKRHGERTESMLQETYERADLRERDKKVLPLIHKIADATQALDDYLKGKRKEDLDTYFKDRDEFVKQLEDLKKMNTVIK